MVKLARLSAIPPVRMQCDKTKVAIYRPRLIENPAFMHIGDRTVIREHGWISAIPRYADQNFEPCLDIGKNVYIGRYVCITCHDGVTIGDGCVLSEHVYIADSGHGIDPDAGPIMEQRLVSRGPVSLGRNCFVGYGARILSGVVLGDHCVVGANAVVNKSFPAYTMIAGLPAKPIKKFNLQNRQWEGFYD